MKEMDWQSLGMQLIMQSRTCESTYGNYPYYVRYLTPLNFDIER